MVHFPENWKEINIFDSMPNNYIDMNVELRAQLQWSTGISGGRTSDKTIQTDGHNGGIYVMLMMHNIVHAGGVFRDATTLFNNKQRMGYGMNVSMVGELLEQGFNNARTVDRVRENMRTVLTENVSLHDIRGWISEGSTPIPGWEASTDGMEEWSARQAQGGNTDARIIWDRERDETNLRNARNQEANTDGVELIDLTIEEVTQAMEVEVDTGRDSKNTGASADEHTKDENTQTMEKTKIKEDRENRKEEEVVEEVRPSGRDEEDGYWEEEDDTYEGWGRDDTHVEEEADEEPPTWGNLEDPMRLYGLGVGHSGFYSAVQMAWEGAEGSEKQGLEARMDAFFEENWTLLASEAPGLVKLMGGDGRCNYVEGKKGREVNGYEIFRTAQEINKTIRV